MFNGQIFSIQQIIATLLNFSCKYNFYNYKIYVTKSQIFLIHNIDSRIVLMEIIKYTDS